MGKNQLWMRRWMGRVIQNGTQTGTDRPFEVSSQNLLKIEQYEILSKRQQSKPVITAKVGDDFPSAEVPNRPPSTRPKCPAVRVVKPLCPTVHPPTHQIFWSIKNWPGSEKSLVELSWHSHRSAGPREEAPWKQTLKINSGYFGRCLAAPATTQCPSEVTQESAPLPYCFSLINSWTDRKFTYIGGSWPTWQEWSSTKIYSETATRSRSFNTCEKFLQYDLLCFLPLHHCIGVPRKQTNNGGREKQTNNKPWYFAPHPHRAVVSAPASVFSCPTRKAFLNKNYSSIWLELVASKNMHISLILTSFDHFQFRSTLGMLSSH